MNYKQILALLMTACIAASQFARANDDSLKEEIYQHIEQRSELEYVTRDGSKLGYFARMASEHPDTALVYLHGIASHSGWFELTANRLAAQGHDVYMLDRRGSGVNRSQRGITAGHIDSWHDWLDDLDDFIRQIRPQYSHIYLIGLSWGGKLATAYGLAHPDKISGLALVTPGLVAAVDYNGIDKLSIAFCHLFCQQSTYPVPVTPAMFSDKPQWVEFIEADPLRNPMVTAEFLWQTRRMDKWIASNINQLQRPTLLFLAGRDEIIDNDKVTKLLFRGQQATSVQHYPKQVHAIQLELPNRLATDISQWLSHKEAP
ncbi:alpha/beta fold hydrolase [Neiella sp. HB171785]|uniref:Alpha/beta fold hydrolase n=1 Tax=Neiella litorisoli TaxID=2771431 RepID=A0A8J6UH36_9GAMM|nr:alpha/beta fold hydrolase [Neiella litorisoli]MBD1391171.1 alpha/beta fold hydrolase [Neiella litorisoli]